MSSAAPVTRAAIAFPSVAWFQQLADIMNANRARQEQLGYVDCVAEFCVVHTGGSDQRIAIQVVFEEFEVLEVCETTPENAARVDFSLQADPAAWQEMIENIAAGGGRPDLEHTLNYLSHMGKPLALVADDPLRSDLYFRYNQSLQEFINASASFQTVFGDVT